MGLVRSDNGRDMSIGEFFLESFNPSIEAGLYYYVKNNPTLDEKARVAGAGLDAEEVRLADVPDGEADAVFGRLPPLRELQSNHMAGAQSLVVEPGGGSLGIIA